MRDVVSHLQLIRFAVLDQQVNELGGVLHEVDVLVHGPVHDQQPPLLVRQLTHKVEDGAELISVGFVTGSVQVPLGVARVIQLPGRDWSPGDGDFELTGVLDQPHEREVAAVGPSVYAHPVEVEVARDAGEPVENFHLVSELHLAQPAPEESLPGGPPVQATPPMSMESL